jgi:aryl-alcohol dehydrogenase-like predicted oxidoreductase
VTAAAVVGTWPLSGDFGAVAVRSVLETLERCDQEGLRTFDTAPNYGDGFMESLLGRVFADRPDIQIQTKCGNRPFLGKSFALDDLKASLEQSLKRLGRDRLHTLYLHNPREISDWEPILTWLEQLKADLVIANAGLSAAKGYEYPDEVLGRFDVIQDDANLLYQAALRTRPRPGVKFAARCPLASGILSGRLTPESTFPAGDHRAGWLKGERLASLVARVRAIEALDERSVPALARAYLLSHPQVDTVIFGVKRPEHVDALAAELGAASLPEETRLALERAHDEDFGLVDQGHLGY